MVFIIAVPLSLTLLLSNRHIQNMLVGKATDYLTEYLDTKVQIGYIEYKIPASIALNDVYIEDQSKDTLAYIKNISASVSISKLFKKSIAIKSVDVDSARFYLKADTLGNTNLNFIIDKFKDQTLGDVDFSFSAPDVHLQGCRFSFDNTDISPKTDNRFDPNHILVDGIDVDITLNHANKDSVLAELNHFACKEKCGFTISHIGTQVSFKDNNLVVSDLNIRMPSSNLKFPDLSAKFDTANISNTTLNFELAKSYISGTDLAGFLPSLGRLRNKLFFSTHLFYKNGSLTLENLNLNYGTGTILNAEASLSNLVELSKKDTITIDDFNNVTVYANINQFGTNRADIENTVSDIMGKPFILPPVINGFSYIRYSGNISGKMGYAKYVGRITTNAGTISTNAQGGYRKSTNTVSIDGYIGTSDFNFEKIFGSDLKIGKLDFDLNANGTYNIKNKRVAASVNGIVNQFQYNNYNFTGLTVDAIVNPDKSIASVKYIDNNGNGTLNMDVFYDNIDSRKFAALEIQADSVNIGAMKLTPKFPTLTLSSDLQLSSHFTSLDDITGEIVLDSTTISNNGLSYFIDKVNVDITKDNLDAGHISVRSPLISANVDGKYTLSTIAKNLQYQIAKELTSIAPLQVKRTTPSNDFTFNAIIKPLTDLTTLFDIPSSIDDTTYISGSFSDYTEYLNVNIETEQILLGKNTIDSVFVKIDTQDDKLTADVNAILQTPRDTTHMFVSTKADNNIVDIDFNFWNTVEKDFSGDLKLTTEFFKPKHKDALIEALCTVHNSELTISDSIWHVNQGTIFYDEHDLIVKNLAFESTDQYLRISGRSNKERNDGIIKVDMKGVNLFYISEAVTLPEIANISLLGIATGKVVIGEALGGRPVLDADVAVQKFGLNGYPIADVNAKAKYNYENNHIEMYAEAMNEKNDTTFMTGYVAPIDQELQLDIDINELHLGFIEPYLESFSHEMDGIASGNLSVGGKFDAVELWGDAYVHDAKLGIDFLGSTFYFADSVHIGRDRFVFPNIHIKDKQGNQGIINGLVTHRLFEQFKYQIDFSINNTMVLNTNQYTSPDFYGTVFASGNALIVGDENKVNISIAAKPEAGSYFAVPLDSYRNATDNQFITFVKKDTIDLSNSAQERRKKRFKELAPTTKVNVDISVEATPDVEAQIIMDSHSGDVIKGRGIGNIKVNVDQNADIKIFGKYEILEGEYNFSLSGAIRKKFEVAENSSITFDGDPMSGMLDIHAKYQTTASLTDLLEESLTKDIKNTSVKVNCLAHITGNLLTPKIKFDLDLPGADDEVVRRVKATVNTDDMMIQQMVFLLVFGKFYNPQLASSQTLNTTSSMATSFATATISSQLNYWMSQISNNVNLGMNYQDANNGDAYRNNSFEMNVTTNLFENRLIIYGNLGYRTQYGSTNFVGDVDVEYKLTKSGRFRLKAYNKTNDMLYSTALYTQGLGVMYKETFDTWKNLGKTYKELTRKKTPEEKAAAKEAKEKAKIKKAKEKAAKKALKEDRKRRHKEYVAQQKALRAQQKALKSKK